jgi:2-polyprenyl-3-methyl-5-hydroxy-6-metoxy-1,4-benzoquinol methylase
LRDTFALVSDPERKQAEIDYPRAIGEEGRLWLRTKPFRNNPRDSARLLIDFAYVLELLELQPGSTMVELGCGSGWMTRFAARHGIRAEGYDISPEMIQIARELAGEEGLDVHFEVGDMEDLDLGRRFDTCVIYQALHHTPRADLVLRAAHRALVPGGRLLLSEPNWKHRFEGKQAAGEYGVTDLGYTPRTLKRLLRKQGFWEIRRFHNNRKRLYSNSPLDTLAHIAEPLVYRALGPFWTQIWLRAVAT